jgi:hypothetical protein
MKDAIAILAGGGPAPGINTVIGTIAKVFLQSGYRVIGLHEGYKSLFSDDPKMTDIDFELADKLHKQEDRLLLATNRQNRRAFVSLLPFTKMPARAETGSSFRPWGAKPATLHLELALPATIR